MTVFIVKFIVPYIHNHRFEAFFQLLPKLVGCQAGVLFIDCPVFRYLDGGAKSHIGIRKEAKDITVINRYRHDLAVELKSKRGLGGQHDAGNRFLNGEQRLFGVVSSLWKQGYGIALFQDAGSRRKNILVFIQIILSVAYPEYRDDAHSTEYPGYKLLPEDVGTGKKNDLLQGVAGIDQHQCIEQCISVIGREDDRLFCRDIFFSPTKDQFSEVEPQGRFDWNFCQGISEVVSVKHV